LFTAYHISHPPISSAISARKKRAILCTIVVGVHVNSSDEVVDVDGVSMSSKEAELFMVSFEDVDV
jgi:hypothetical protein